MDKDFVKKKKLKIPNKKFITQNEHIFANELCLCAGVLTWFLHWTISLGLSSIKIGLFIDIFDLKGTSFPNF